MKLQFYRPTFFWLFIFSVVNSFGNRCTTQEIDSDEVRLTQVLIDKKGELAVIAEINSRRKTSLSKAYQSMMANIQIIVSKHVNGQDRYQFYKNYGKNLLYSIKC